MMDSSSLLIAWGREILRENGFTVGDEECISFDTRVVEVGCCELCLSNAVEIMVTSSGGASTYADIDVFY